MRWDALWQAILAAATLTVAGTQLADVIGHQGAGILGLIVGALQVGTATYYTATRRAMVAPGPTQ